MADVTDAPVPTGSSEFDIPGDLGRLADHFGDSDMFAVPTTADLPASDNWPGRTLMTSDNKIVYLWTGSGWVPMFSPWIAYTPTSSTLSVGGGSSLTRYRYVAGRVLVHLRYTIGNLGNISGIAKVALPVTRAALSHDYQASPELGHAYSGPLATPTTTNFMFPVLADGGSVTVVRFGYGLPSVTGDVTAAVPFAVNSGSVYEAVFSYDPA